WLAGGLEYVDGADAEMAALHTTDLHRMAVADASQRDALGSEAPSLAPGDTVRLTSYTPNRLAYDVTTRDGGLCVFSEVYFPWGWKATVDGAPAPLGRVNYLLRAMRVPAGRHEVVMTFDPQSIHTTTAVAYASVSMIYLLVLGAIFRAVLRKEEKEEAAR
ncbi:MAG: YfhO family protein, partial [Muribaculaceae bacterium]|nr:YfhO family protein [Muribaculaceae bacterium]